MGKLAKQTKAEFKQLPLMLGKVPGGFLGDVLPSLLVGAAGIVIFVFSGRALTRRIAPAGVSQSSHRGRASLLPWALFLLFVLLFLAGGHSLSDERLAVDPGGWHA
jgi:hypothetical protein